MGIEVGVWWTDDPAEILRLAAAGVRVVFTNVPGSWGRQRRVDVRGST